MKSMKSAKFYEWMQPYYLREAAASLQHWIELRNTDRACAGLPLLKRKILENKEVTDHLSDVYFDLKIKNHIEMDFQEFLLEVDCFCTYGRLRCDLGIRRYRWNRTGCDFRGHTKYVRNIDHEPKDRKDDSWRAHKGIDRDKSRRGCWYKSAKRGLINKEERSFRRWTKAQIKSGNYDALGDDWLQNKWIWD